LILPRRASLRETRNEHQVATAGYFSQREGILVAKDERIFHSILDEWKTQRISIKMKSAEPYADERLIQTIRDFIQNK